MDSMLFFEMECKARRLIDTLALRLFIERRDGAEGIVWAGFGGEKREGVEDM